jgi:hypothetical protein
MKNSVILASVLMFSTALTGSFYSANYDFMQAHAEDDCEDKAFKKYMKKGDKPFDKYLDKADDVPLPKDKDDADDYLDELDPLAKDYVDDLQPFAEQYIDDLEDCLN